jgi:hypothetical protein
LASPTGLDRFGESVASAGLFDEDTKADFVVGAPGLAASKTGLVALFFGRNTASGGIHEDILITGEDGYAGDNGGDAFGKSVAGGVDLTGDGYGDLVVGAPYHDYSASVSNSGAVYVFAGDERDNLASSMTAGTSTAHSVMYSETHQESFGAKVAIVGDVTGDGTPDIAVGAPASSGYGSVYIYEGGANLTSTPAASARIIGEQETAMSIGYKIEPIGDVNVDGYDDFYVGSGSLDAQIVGRAAVIYGGAYFQKQSTTTALSLKDVAVDLFDGDAGAGEYDRLGQSAVGLGDRNEDGLPDFAISAPTDEKSGTGTLTGTVYIWDSALNLVDVSDQTELAYQGDTPYAAVSINYDRSDTNDKGPDLFVTFDGAADAPRLWKNNTASVGASPEFINVTLTAFVTGEEPEDGSRGIAVADFNNDGELDMFVAHATDPMFYENLGSAGGYKLDNVADTKLSGADKSVAGAWGDYDRDGYLDLYVVRASGTLSYTGITGEQDRLYRSEEYEDNGFTDVTSAAGLTTSALESVTASWIDADADGNLDLYVGELGQSTTGKFYLSDGDGTFTDATNAASGPAIGGMSGVSGIAWADMDRDADLDLIVAKMLTGGSPINLVTCGNGAGRFYDENGWLDGDLSEPLTGVMALDFDLNGVMDVLGAPEGAVTPPLHSGFDDSGEFFVERSARVGLGAKATKGLAVFDGDGDGDQDVYLGRAHSGATAESDVFHMGSRAAGSVPAANWLGIRLIGDTYGNNKEGIGSRIRIRVPATGALEYETIKQVGASSGRGGQDELVTYFGLGMIDEAGDGVKVTVEWPDGYSESRVYTIDNANESLRLNGIRDFGEGDHDPAIRNGTFTYYCQPSPGEEIDHVIEWEADYNTFPDQISARFQASSKNGGGCWDPPTDPGQDYKTVSSSMPNVEATVVPLPDGGYKCTLRWKDRPCAAGCEYTAFDPSATRAGSLTDATSDSDDFIIPACLQ